MFIWTSYLALKLIGIFSDFFSLRRMGRKLQRQVRKRRSIRFRKTSPMRGSLLKCMDCLIASVRAVAGRIEMSWRTRASFAPLSLTNFNQKGAAKTWIRIRRRFSPEQKSLSAADAETFWRATCLTNRLYLASHKYCAVEPMNNRVLFQPSCSVGQ